MGHLLCEGSTVRAHWEPKEPGVQNTFSCFVWRILAYWWCWLPHRESAVTDCSQQLLNSFSLRGIL